MMLRYNFSVFAALTIDIVKSISLANLAMAMHAARSIVIGNRRYANGNTADRGSVSRRRLRAVNDKI